VQLAAEAVEKAAELAEAERRRLRAGASNLIFVNVREQAAADARMRLLEATAETHLAWAQWENYERLQCERG
jgi:outer membrane protein TolC